MAPPLFCDPAITCSSRTPTTSSQVSFTFTNLPTAGSVAEQVDLGAFAEHADGGAAGVVGVVEELAFGKVQAVDDGVGGLRLRRAPEYRGKAWAERAAGCSVAAGGEGFERFDIGFEDADVALRESGGGAAALLELFVAGGGAGIDEDVAHAQLLDEAQGLLARAGADGQHADDGTDTEDDAERGEQGARLLGAQVARTAWPRSETRIIGRGPSWRRRIGACRF